MDRRNIRFGVPEDVVVRDLSGEAVLLHLGTQTYFGLDAVGTRIWQLLAEHGTVERIVPLLLEEFLVEEHSLRRDIGTLIERLLAKGLLTPEPASDG